MLTPLEIQKIADKKDYPGALSYIANLSKPEFNAYMDYVKQRLLESKATK